MPLVTDIELAKALHRTRAAIRQAVIAGRLTPRPDKLFDLDQAVAEFNRNTHHARGHNNRSAAKPAEPKKKSQLAGYVAARAETQIYEGLIKKLRYEERAGNLTPTVDVEQARFTEFRSLREACFNLPARVAALLAGESDVARCQQILEAELRKIFTAFADGNLEVAA